MEINEKWKSRKFWAFIVGIIVYTITVFIPSIDPTQVEGIIWLIISYILGQSGIDIVDGIRIKKR